MQPFTTQHITFIPDASARRDLEICALHEAAHSAYIEPKMTRNDTKVLAGASGWTAERREKQSLAIHRWQPWLKAGLKKGDSRGSMNALKHGARSRRARELQALLSQIEAALNVES